MNRGFSLIELCIALCLCFLIWEGILALQNFILQQSHKMKLLIQVEELSEAGQLLEKSIAHTNQGICAPFDKLIISMPPMPLSINDKVIYQNNDPLLKNFFTGKQTMLTNSNSLLSNTIDHLPNQIISIAPQKIIISAPCNFHQEEWFALDNCKQLFIFRANTIKQQGQQIVITPDKNLPNNFTLPAVIGRFSQTLWFVMKNPQNNFGLYQKQLLNDGPPVEILSQITQFNANFFMLNPHTLILKIDLATTAKNNLHWHVLIGKT